MVTAESQQQIYVADDNTWKKWRLVWLIAFAAGIVIIARDSETVRESLVGLGQIHRIIAISLLAIITTTFFVRNPSVPFKSIFFFWTLFAIWQIITAIWSTFPSWTLYRSVEYLIMVLITEYCANSLKDSAQFYKWVNLIWCFIGFMVFSVWLGVIISPNLALGPSHGMIPFSINGVLPRINSN